MQNKIQKHAHSSHRGGYNAAAQARRWFELKRKQTQRLFNRLARKRLTQKQKNDNILPFAAAFGLSADNGASIDIQAHIGTFVQNLLEIFNPKGFLPARKQHELVPIPIHQNGPR